MQIAPKPIDEIERLAALERLDVLDTLPQQVFDDITALASVICGTPVALISLVDDKRQWFKSRLGLESTQTSREVSFCAHAILKPMEVMVVEDATSDARFKDNPLVRGATNIRFYAGAPIVTSDGFALGTVCVIDHHPRTLSPPQIEAMRTLSRMVANFLEHDETWRAESLRQAERERRTNEHLIASTVGSLDLQSVIDASYVCRFVNDTYLDYWQRKRDEIEGLTVAELVGEQAFLEQEKLHIDDALAGRGVTYETTLEFPARGTIHVEVNYLPARNTTGKIIGVVKRVHDIQRLKQREDQLHKTIQALETKTIEQERFIHIVSHDLREPVNTIVNFSSLLAEHEIRQTLSAAATRYVDFVERGGRRMKLLLDELIRFIRLENYTIESRPIALNQLVQEAKADLASVISRSGAMVECDELPTVAGDATFLRLLIQNLLSNAIKFSRKGTPPVVSISARESDGKHEIRVRDNGIGIPSDQLENVFNIFTRLHSRKEYDGTGLGLSICRRIVDAHGGNIFVTSEPGQGSSFVFTLPRHELAQGG